MEPEGVPGRRPALRCGRAADRAVLPRRPAAADPVCESLVDGGEDSPLYGWAADTLESVVPQLVKMRILTEDTIAIETFERRLRTAVVEARSQVVGPAQFCAWTRI